MITRSNSAGDPATDESLHPPDIAFSRKAPVVPHGIPPKDELRDVDNLVHEDRQLCDGEVPLQHAQRLDGLQVKRPGFSEFEHLVLRIAFDEHGRCVQERIQHIGYGFVRRARMFWPNGAHDVGDASPEESEPVRGVGLAGTFDGLERRLVCVNIWLHIM